MREETIDLTRRSGASFIPWILLVAVIGLGVWGYFSAYQPVADRLQSAEVALAKANGEVQRANAAGNTAQADLQKLQDELKQARADLALSAAQKDADGKLLAELKQQVGNAEVQGENGQITVTMVDKVLFKSGEADLSPDGEATLQRLGTVLKHVDKMIEVAGHADNQAVKSEIRQLYPTNWELSTARATNVVRFLQEVARLNPRRLKATGYGSYRPVASNATEKGRARNRRIEILLLPMKMKIQKGDFSDELAAADKVPVKHLKGADDKQRLKAVVAMRQKTSPQRRSRK